VREIHHAHHAEDDRQAKCHQAVDQTGQQPAGGDVKVNLCWQIYRLS
jgi:hypothetical protein